MSNFLINTDFNNQKILVNELRQLPGGVLATTVFEHNLGYIPVVRVWYEPIPGQWYPASIRSYSAGLSSGIFMEKLCSYSVSTTELFIEVRNMGVSFTPTNIRARIYLDD